MAPPAPAARPPGPVVSAETYPASSVARSLTHPQIARNWGARTLESAPGLCEVTRMQKKSYEATSPILEAIAQASRLSREDERELVRAARSGNQEAAHRLIEAYLPLVARIAKRNRSHPTPRVHLNDGWRTTTPSFDLDDLIQEGRLGLLDALRTFDPERAVRFATFATPHVEGHIKRALSNQAHTIRLPVHQQAALGRVDKARETLRKELEREPSRQEVAAAVGMSVADLEEIDRAAAEPISLDTPIASDDEDDTIDSHDRTEGGQVQADQIVPLPSPADLADRKDISRIAAHVLSALLSSQREVLRLRCGFYGDALSPAEAAHRLGIRRSTLDKSEQAALAKAREVLAGMGYGPELLAAFDLKRRRTR